MFYFYHSNQDLTNTAHYKGILFENLLAEFLSQSGYLIDELRRKSRSLEYDIVAHHDLDGRRVLGEAKAHDATLGSSDITSFVGKYVAEYHEDPRLVGVLLSTSAITPDAKDYLRGLRDKAPYDLHFHCGEELEAAIRHRAGFPTRESLPTRVTQAIPYVRGQHVLYTDAGTFVLVVGAGMSSGYPDRFALLRPDGQTVADSALSSALQEAIPALQDLDAVVQLNEGAHPTSRPLATGIVEASSWTDYRHPTGPAYFVGRSATLGRLRQLLSDERGAGVVELKARSGVGKSSTLLVLQAQLRDRGHSAWIHDARDVRSASDVWTVLASAMGCRVSGYEDLDGALQNLTSTLGTGQLAVFLIDQFEVTLQSSEVFAAYDYLARAVSGIGNLGIVLARKDDLLTTHDDLRVDLNRLRDLATSVSLEDLKRDEAVDLLHAAAAKIEPRLSNNVLAQVLEFAQGFPWLLKRTLAHVVDSLSAGASAQELESSGLHLEELFQEEVSGLDEVERGYLTRLAAVLPATYRAVMQRFDDDPELPAILDQLTQRRVLRHSSGTYDTYNDVFKEYLLFQRLPERSHSYLFRQRPGPVLEAFRVMRANHSWDIDSLQEALGRQIGSTYNLLRELRVLGLVQKREGKWEIPQVARDYEHRSRLGEYVRQSVLKNQVVIALLSRLERTPVLRRDELVEFLEKHFPFVEASQDIWRRYVNQLLAWLTTLRFITRTGDGDIRAVHAQRDDIVDELGNLKVAVRGSRPDGAPFVPSRGWATVELLFERAAGTSQRPLTRGQRTLLSELEDFLVLKRTEDGLAALVDLDEFRRAAKTHLDRPPYSHFWDCLTSGGGYLDCFRATFRFDELANSTCIGLAKKLANWGRSLDLLPSSGRYPEHRKRPHTAVQREIDSLMEE